MLAAVHNRAGMIDRPDRDIEAGAAGAGCRHEGNGYHKSENASRFRARSCRRLHLGSSHCLDRRRRRCRAYGHLQTSMYVSTGQPLGDLAPRESSRDHLRGSVDCGSFYRAPCSARSEVA